MTTGKKRANGEGSLRKRPDGRWEGRYKAGRDPVTGKAVYKNVLAKTQKECREKLAQAIEKSGKIDVTKAGQYTVEEWCWLWHENPSNTKVEGYLEHLKRKGRAQGTIGSHRRKIRRLYEDLPEDGKVILDGTLGLWREKLAEDGCSLAAINQFIVAANGYLEYMGAREYQVVDKLDAVADAQRPGFCHPERETDRPDQRDGVYPSAVPGGPAAGGERQPRCLRKLYQATREGIERNVTLLVEQAQDRLMEEEQLEIGWDG